MGNRQGAEAGSPTDRLVETQRKLANGLITAEEASHEITRIGELARRQRFIYDDDSLFTGLDALGERLTQVWEAQEELVGLLHTEVPQHVHPQLEGWAVRMDQSPGGTVEEIFEFMTAERSMTEVRDGKRVPTHSHPPGFKGACYVSTYALVETLNGRPTKISFNKETPLKEFGETSRVERLGPPIRENISRRDFLSLVRRGEKGTIYEFRAFDETNTGHACVAISPNFFIDMENALTGRDVLETITQFGYRHFTVWRAGRVTPGIGLPDGR